METQLEKEMRFHIDEHTNELIAQGRSPEEARRQARLTIGGPEQVKEVCRDARGTRWLEDFVQDFLYAIRNLRNQPGFALVALLTLGTRYRRYHRDVYAHQWRAAETVALSRSQAASSLCTATPPIGIPPRSANKTSRTPIFLDFQREGHSLDFGGWVFEGSTLSAPGDPEYLTWFQSSASLFPLLGVTPIRRPRILAR